MRTLQTLQHAGADKMLRLSIPVEEPNRPYQLVIVIAPQDETPYPVVPAEEYARIRADLTVKGMLIGPNDLLIAAIALASKQILVTHNTREFTRVVGLAVEDWLVP